LVGATPPTSTPTLSKKKKQQQSLSFTFFDKQNFPTHKFSVMDFLNQPRTRAPPAASGFQTRTPGGGPRAYKKKSQPPQTIVCR
ncbi:hypothetical protein ACVGWI_00420, partial [Enterobacter hormaechei]